MAMRGIMSEGRPITRVFISSTWEDLEKERGLVLEAVRYIQFQHVAMEYFGADPRESIDVCLEKVRESNVYVGIVAHKYGKIVQETGKSYTQMEYEEAMRKGLPCLIYLRSEEFPIPPKFIEQDPDSINKLALFKSTLKNSHTPSYFNDGNDLALKVVVGLARQVKSLDYEVLNRILAYVASRFRRIQQDNDFKFHYLQKRLETLGLIKLGIGMCPVCGRALEEEESTFGMKHPVCVDCLVLRDQEVRTQLKEDHPEFLSFFDEVRKDAEAYIEKRDKRPKS